MNLRDFIKKLIRNYFIIFALIVICTTITRQIFSPNTSIELMTIYLYMICALITDLLSLVLYSSKELSEKQLLIRKTIHFILLQVVLFVFVNLLDFVNSIYNIIIFEIQITVIYISIRFLSWIYDKKSADDINTKLNIMKEELKFHDEK